jgi:SSS family solute:Na+ symporter
MSLQLALSDRILIFLYLFGILALGVFRSLKRQNEDEFLIAGRRLSLGAFVATLVSTFYGGILGVGEFTYRYGLVSWLTQGFFYYVFALVYAVYLAPKIRRNQQYTLPDQLYSNYNRATGLLGSFFTFILVSPAPYVLMIGTLLHLIFGWPLFQAILIGTAFSSVYVLFGGFRSVVRTDILQFFLMFAGFGLLLPFAWSSLGSLFDIFRQLPAGHTSLVGKLSLQQIGAWAVIALWTIVSPTFFQRCSAAKSEAVARKGILAAIGFWFLFDMMTLSAGFYARYALAGIDPVMAYPLLGEMVLPAVVKGIFIVGLLATIMSTLDSMSFLSAITLGRDFIWRLRGGVDEKSRIASFTRLGLLLSLLLSIIIAAGFQSVIVIWYVLGSLAIPVLLLPILTSFFPGMMLSSRSTFGMMAVTSAFSVLWLIWGYVSGEAGEPAYLLGIEPMYPGLVISAGWWVVGRIWNH